MWFNNMFKYKKEETYEEPVSDGRTVQMELRSTDSHITRAKLITKALGRDDIESISVVKAILAAYKMVDEGKKIDPDEIWPMVYKEPIPPKETEKED